MLTQVQSGMLQTTAQYYGFKNRIINGAMVIDQRNNGASLTITNISGNTYTLDRWAVYGSIASKFSVQQNAGSVTPPVGYINYLGATSLSSYSVGSGEYYYLAQYIEGLNCADLAFGSSTPATVTLSFWVRSSVTGTFSGSLGNSAFNRSYPFTYTISSANTWTQISLTIAGDNTGTWLTTNGTGLAVYFNIGSGANNLGTAGSWTGSGKVGATGSQSIIATNGATFYVTGVQLEVGTQATSFDYRPYGTELALCQRYYAKLGATYSNYAAFGAGTVVTTTQADIFVKYPVTMRGAATATVSGGKINAGTSSNPISSISSSYSGTDSIYITFATSAGGMIVAQGALVCANNNAPDFLAFSAEL